MLSWNMIEEGYAVVTDHNYKIQVWTKSELEPDQKSKVGPFAWTGLY